VGGEGIDSAPGEAGVESEGDIRRVDHLLQHEAESLRQALTAQFGISGQRGPASLGIGLVGLHEPFWGKHLSILETTPLLIATLVQGLDHLFEDLCAFIQDGIHQIGAHLLESRQCRQGPVAVQEFAEYKQQVADGGFVGGH